VRRFFFTTSVSLCSVYNINEVFVIAAGELGEKAVKSYRCETSSSWKVR
jgi:hypothetical protein